MGSQVLQHGQFALDNALRLDMRCTVSIAMLIESVLLHLVHGRADLACISSSWFFGVSTPGAFHRR
jgi:hypothetical protein